MTINSEKLFIILVIDSGVGGLSITEQIRARCPQIIVRYIADCAQFPYGSKSETEVSQRIRELVAYGVQHGKPDLVVIACNTASTIALESLRAHFNIPVVGVVPAIKPAAALSINGIIGVLATNGTVSRTYTQNLIESFAPHLKVHLYGSPVLANEAELKLKGIAPDTQRIRDDVLMLTNQNPAMDTVVLACTHFPLLKPELELLFPNIKHWIDSGAAIARRVEFLLANIYQPHQSTRTKNQFIVTGGASVDYQKQSITLLLGSYDEMIVDI